MSKEHLKIYKVVSLTIDIIKSDELSSEGMVSLLKLNLLLALSSYRFLYQLSNQESLHGFHGSFSMEYCEGIGYSMSEDNSTTRMLTPVRYTIDFV